MATSHRSMELNKLWMQVATGETDSTNSEYTGKKFTNLNTLERNQLSQTLLLAREVLFLFGVSYCCHS